MCATLLLPSLFPYIVTGSITASGGAWNASIVAEHVEFGGRTFFVTGIGATIANATATGNYALLLAATLGMILTVVAMNRLVWRPLYRLAEERFRMEYWTWTAGYEAAPFYQKQGYVIFCEFEDYYPTGHSRIGLRKRL